MTYNISTVSTLHAVMRREALTVRHNRFIQVFALVLVVGSGLASALAVRAEAVPFSLLLLFLYVVPLFGLLAGVSAADEDRVEYPFLLSQPVRPRVYIQGKVITLCAAMIGVLGIALVPAAVVVSTSPPVLLLGFLGSVLAVVSVTGGLALGYYTSTRARGLMAAILMWFGAFALYDVLALAFIDIGFIRSTPLIWVAALLLNPADAVRITGLFGLEGVPFSAAGPAEWIEPLIAWLPIWTALLTVVWTWGLLVLAFRRLESLDL